MVDMLTLKENGIENCCINLSFRYNNTLSDEEMIEEHISH
jgi:hypothetical protein